MHRILSAGLRSVLPRNLHVAVSDTLTAYQPLPAVHEQRPNWAEYAGIDTAEALQRRLWAYRPYTVR